MQASGSACRQIIAAFCTLYFGFLLLLPSFKANMTTLFIFIAITFNLWVGWVIIDMNWAYEWHTSTTTINTVYAPYDPRRITAELGLHVGLHGINITFVGKPSMQFGQVINYNEQFLWSGEHGGNAPFHQGRFGFGPYAGAIAQQFHEKQFQGYPQVICELAQYFTLDGEDIRWGRWYRIAGWYSHITLWTCVPLWFLANVIVLMRPSVGCIWWILLGWTQILVIMIYSIVIIHNNLIPLVIPYEGGKIEPKLGWCWYLVLFTGVMCVFAGVAGYIYIMYHPEYNHNLLDERDIPEEEKPEEVQFDASQTVTLKKRRASQFGAQTMVQRKPKNVPAKTLPSAEAVAETKVDAPRKEKKSKQQSEPMTSSAPMSNAPPMHAHDVEMQPMSSNEGHDGGYVDIHGGDAAPMAHHDHDGYIDVLSHNEGLPMNKMLSKTNRADDDALVEVHM